MSPSSKTVSMFIPCLVDAFHPEVGEAMIALLERAGMRVEYPLEQTCCGQPAFNSGYRTEAAAAARHFVSVFEQADAIVCPSGSCVHMVRRHYPELLADDADWRHRAETVSRRTYELTQYLVDVLEVVDFGARFNGRITYHDSCHLLRGLGIREQPRELLRHIQGAELVEMDESDRCCGFGGAFSVKYPEISTALLEDKVDTILATGADAVVGADPSCLMNIEGMVSRRGLSVKVLHIAELLVG